MWNNSLKRFEVDYLSMKTIVNDKSHDLFSKIPHGSGQTIFREILQIIDHNSYHIGQLVMMRKLVGEWK
jgi:L-ribulose-5-phosphate 3-epimerase UlaE